MTPPARAAARSAAPARRPAPRPESRPSERHLRVVRSSRRRRLRLTAVGVIGFTLTAVFGVVAFNVFLVQSQFRLERLEKAVEEERAEFERLRLEEARLSSPERVLDIARTRLGMVEPATITYLTAPDHGQGAAGQAAAHGVNDWAEVKPIVAAEP